MPSRRREGRGARRPCRSSRDRFHLVLLVTARGRLAVLVRRDVLRGVEQALSRARIRGASRGRSRPCAQRSREDESDRERGRAAGAHWEQAVAGRTPRGELEIILATPAGGRGGGRGRPPPLFFLLRERGAR